jgi:hypothetical protein
MTKKTMLTAAVLTAGLAIAAPLAAAGDDTASERTPASTPRPSGIYALTTEQIAYYEGFLAGRGYEVDLESPWALSELEISALRGSEAGDR